MCEYVKRDELDLAEYFNATEEWMLKVICEMLQFEETKNAHKKRVKKTRQECFIGKRLHRKFIKDVKWLMQGHGTS